MTRIKQLVYRLTRRTPSQACKTAFRHQGRNEVYGIRDQRPKKGWDQGSQPRIRDQSPRDRDQRVFHGLKDQASR